MMKISQKEARRLRKRVRELEQAERHRRRSWGQEWLGGVIVTSFQWPTTDQHVIAIRTARKIGHAVVVTGDDNGMLRFVALPHPDVTL